MVDLIVAGSYMTNTSGFRKDGTFYWAEVGIIYLFM